MSRIGLRRALEVFRKIPDCLALEAMPLKSRSDAKRSEAAGAGRDGYGRHLEARKP